MKETHEKTIIFAVCEDKSIHQFGTFSESTVGDDILGHYKIGSEIGSYCFTPNSEESNGLISAMPDSVSLQAYLKGEPNEEYDGICKVLDIKSKIKEFYWLNTDLCRDDNHLLFFKITANNIEMLNDGSQITTTVPNVILWMLLLDAVS
jgi:hypothetical protein